MLSQIFKVPSSTRTWQGAEISTSGPEIRVIFLLQILIARFDRVIALEVGEYRQATDTPDFYTS
jgi:hypothetical protein